MLPDELTKSTADDETLAAKLREFAESQEPLGEPFATILMDNLWELYESDNDT